MIIHTLHMKISVFTHLFIIYIIMQLYLPPCFRADWEPLYSWLLYALPQWTPVWSSTGGRWCSICNINICLQRIFHKQMYWGKPNQNVFSEPQLLENTISLSTKHAGPSRAGATVCYLDTSCCGQWTSGQQHCCCNVIVLCLATPLPPCRPIKLCCLLHRKYGDLGKDTWTAIRKFTCLHFASINNFVVNCIRHI